jgi:hypothetical protein
MFVLLFPDEISPNEYSLGPPRPIGASADDRKPLFRVAKQSGGRLFIADARRLQMPASRLESDIAVGLQHITDEVYRLEVEVAAPISKPEGLNVQAVDGQGNKLKHVELIFPQRVIPCPFDKQD